MESGSWQPGKMKPAHQGPHGARSASGTGREADRWTRIKGDASMQPEARSGRVAAVQARPLAELLQCPAGTGNLLDGAAQYINVDAGDVVFRQSDAYRGLYVVISGQFLRRTKRLETRLTLGVARAGDLVELAAVLGDGRHTYTLNALSTGSVLLLPREDLSKAFDFYPPLRMRLLEELAREVSRGYEASCQSRTPKARRRSAGAPAA